MWPVNLITFLTICATINGYRILGVFPHFGKSHFDIFQPVMQELASQGHDVTVLGYHPHPGAGYKDLVLKSEVFTGGDLLTFDMVSTGYIAKLREVLLIHFIAREACELGLVSKPVRDLLKMKSKFDVIIVEAFNTDCYLGLVHRLGAPFIHISSSQLLPWFAARFGQPDNPAYISDAFMGYSDRLTFEERVINTIANLWNQLAYQYLVVPTDYEYAKKAFGNDLPKLEVIAANVSLCILNEHFSMQRPKPIVPGVIHVAGIHLTNKRVHKLPQVKIKRNILFMNV